MEINQGYTTMHGQPIINIKLDCYFFIRRPSAPSLPFIASKEENFTAIRTVPNNERPVIFVNSRVTKFNDTASMKIPSLDTILGYWLPVNSNPENLHKNFRKFYPIAITPIPPHPLKWPFHRNLPTEIISFLLPLRSPLRSLRRADHSSRGVLPTVVRRCVWSRNIKNRCSIYIWH